MESVIKSSQVKYKNITTTDSDGKTEFKVNKHILLSASANLYILIPYTRTGSEYWYIRVMEGSYTGHGYQGTCLVAYIEI